MCLSWQSEFSEVRACHDRAFLDSVMLLDSNLPIIGMYLSWQSECSEGRACHNRACHDSVMLLGLNLAKLSPYHWYVPVMASLVKAELVISVSCCWVQILKYMSLLKYPEYTQAWTLRVKLLFILTLPLLLLICPCHD